MRRALPIAARAWWRGASIGIACGVACWALALQPVGRGLEEWLQDANFAFRGGRTTKTKIVIVALDDESLASLPKPMTAASPELAEVVTYLDNQGASAIGIDVFVPDTLDDYDQQAGLGGKAMGLAAARSGKVVMPVALGDGGRAIRPLTSWQTAAAYGLIQLKEDLDHFVRRHQLAAVVGGEAYDGFPLALLEVAGRIERTGDVPSVGGRRVPLDSDGCVRINYVGPPETLPHISFREILAAARARARPPADVAGAIVIIGATARSVGDLHSTPYSNGSWAIAGLYPSGLMSGPEVQANALATLADGAYINTPWWLAPLPWAVLVGAALGAAFTRMKLSQGAAICLIHHFGWRGIALVAFWYGHWRVEMLSILATGAVSYAAAFAFRWRWLRRMYGVARGEAIAFALENDFDHLHRRGEMRELTVMFADIRGFTAFSESHSPAEVVALLNAYFTEIVPVVEVHGGSINLYMGDGLMALFGTPSPRADHAAAAVRAAAEILARVHAAESRWSELHFVGMRIGIGVHTGPAIVGTVGSPSRLDYSAVGDTVNTAARIESENKALGSEILISAATRRAVPDSERARLGIADDPTFVQVKGKIEVLEIYRVDPDRSRAATNPRLHISETRPAEAIPTEAKP